MRTFDFSPLYRAAIGYDHMNRLMENLARQDDSQGAYPPYNIEKADEDNYRITMAVAGFAPGDLDITVEQDDLIVRGRTLDGDDTERTYLHRGIATRAFERRFTLAEHIKVTGADMVNGLLHIDLVREIPEEAKPRKIAIGAADATATKRVEDKSTADKKKAA